MAGRMPWQRISASRPSFKCLWILGTDLRFCAGITYLSCPVFGRPDAVAARKCVRVLSGPEEGKKRVRPLLEPLGRAVLGHRIPFNFNFVFTVRTERERHWGQDRAMRLG